MSLISIVIVLIVVGLLLWLALTYIPMAKPFPQIITAVVIITILWLLKAFGLLDGLGSVKV